jgi:transposase-like protein
MCALATHQTVDPVSEPSARSRAPGLDLAVARVMLGAPPAMVAADLGCSVATLMRWVKDKRRRLRRATRENPAPVAADAEPAARVIPMLRHLPDAQNRDRAARERAFVTDRPVEPEDPMVVEAAYQAAEFDYSGRRAARARPLGRAP